jgi:DNA-directed RNA polymerase delta subunit
MAKNFTWFRLYADIINDEKILSLTAEDRWHYIAICCLMCDGTLSKYEGDELVKKMRIKLRMSEADLRETLKRLETEKLVSSRFIPAAWNKRQFKSDVSTDRVRRYRSKQKQELNNKHKNRSGNVSRNGAVTPPETESDTDIEKAQDSSSLSPKRKPPPDDALDIPASLDRRAKTGRRLSEDWKPEQLTSRFASLAKCTISEINQVAPLEFEKFRNYWLAKTGKDATKLDWQKTWENWLLKALQDHYRGRHAVPRNQREPDPLQEAVRRRMEGGND